MPHLDKWRGRVALVVDDSPSHLFVAVECLKDLGFASVYQAENGKEALRILQTLEQVDFILTDLSMPGMDGIELLGCLAKAPKHYFISVMSGVPRDVLDTVQGIADASNLELLAVMPKPVTIESMSALLKKSDPDLHASGPAWPQFEFSVDDVALAMDAQELRLYFQPKVTIVDKKIVGFEALARWLHPTHGVLPPIAFIHHVEQGDLALRFFYALLSTACDMVKTLQTVVEEIHCSINLPVPLLDNAELVDKMQAIVEAKGVESKFIIIEVTETTLMSNLATFLGALARLRIKGFGLAMDDYGTGYSSMKQLSRCPFTEIKIDKEFVHDAANSPKKLAILTSAISMSQRLNLKVVAEGVENADDWEQLSALGCDIAQGYFISRPIPEEKVLEWIAKWQRP
ncbi:MAG: EAL domain-containing response regulator [Proteobacteria bacterium]|nr:EAL domain-containing response regulator [Pseudomonadota bacterium]